MTRHNLIRNKIIYETTINKTKINMKQKLIWNEKLIQSDIKQFSTQNNLQQDTTQNDIFDMKNYLN